MKKPNAPRHDDADLIQCPKCGYRFPTAHQCPRCGYNGYFPMSDRQAKRIKWILYPILLAAALAVYLIIRKNAA